MLNYLNWSDLDEYCTIDSSRKNKVPDSEVSGRSLPWVFVMGEGISGAKSTISLNKLIFNKYLCFGDITIPRKFHIRMQFTSSTLFSCILPTNWFNTKESHTAIFHTVEYGQLSHLLIINIRSICIVVHCFVCMCEFDFQCIQTSFWTLNQWVIAVSSVVSITTISSSH